MRPAFLLALAGISFAAGLPVYDGFEPGDLSSIWMRRNFVPGAVEIQSKVVRAGKGAAKVTLRMGEKFEAGTPGALPSERAELLETPELWALEERTYTYSFSMFIPRDFPIVRTRLVIAQWKQFCPQTPCDPDNPVLSIRYIGGTLLIQQYAGARKVVLYRTEEEIRYKWLDFRFEIRFSQQPVGLVRAWLNERAIIDHRGITAYQEQGGYPSHNRFYFKMGLYRDRMPEPMTLYVDEYRKQEKSPPSQ